VEVASLSERSDALLLRSVKDDVSRESTGDECARERIRVCHPSGELGGAGRHDIAVGDECEGEAHVGSSRITRDAHCAVATRLTGPGPAAGNGVAVRGEREEEAVPGDGNVLLPGTIQRAR